MSTEVLVKPDSLEHLDFDPKCAVTLALYHNGVRVRDDGSTCERKAEWHGTCPKGHTALCCTQHNKAPRFGCKRCKTVYLTETWEWVPL